MIKPSSTSPKPGEAYLADERTNPTPRALEVLVDQGSYALARQMLGLEDEPTTTETQPAKNIGAYTCGDCLVELSNGQRCPHMVVDAAGVSRIIG